jgi:hypothetical protein
MQLKNAAKVVRRETMKKQVLAIVLSIVMASGSIGSVPAFAAEADNQEASIEIEQIAEETASGAETAEETD